MNETNSNNLSLEKKILDAIKSKSNNIDQAKETLISGVGGMVSAIPKVMTNMAELIKAEVESQNLQTEAFYDTYNKIIEFCTSQMKKESVSEKDMEQYFKLLFKIVDSINEDKKRNDEHHYRMKEILLGGVTLLASVTLFVVTGGKSNIKIPFGK